MATSSSSSSWREGMSSDNIKGLCLALSSSFFIGASFIVKKKGLKKAGASGIRAGSGGYSYLYEPLCAALAHIILRERLHIFGILGCVLCVVGSTTIVLHAPQEREIESVSEVWDLAMEPAMVITATFILIFHFIPLYGQTHIMVYIGVCSLVGSLTVMSVKALGIVIKLTLSGMNQLIYPQTWAFTLVVLVCVLTQMNYLNKDWDRQSPTQVITEICGFVTILSGTFLLHKTKDMADGLQTSLSIRLPKHSEEDGFDGGEGIPLRRQESMRLP
ncbi:hypothetical protein JHK82_045665 [Glycine max]|nr:hypothetical protein JHK82_045665 [Glycine max]